MSTVVRLGAAFAALILLVAAGASLLGQLVASTFGQISAVLP